MNRSTSSKSGIAAFLYGIICYGVFFGVFLYAIGFIGGFVTPTRIDGAPTRPVLEALLVDLALLGLFAVQHSVMARPRSSAGGPASSPSRSSAVPMCS
jgi:protein-S-isoprenylcysteine O-methyltransferase Ste14